MDLKDSTWLEAQQGVLGSVLISPELAPRVVARTRDSDYTGTNLLIFQAIRSIFQDGKPVDVILIASKLGNDKEITKYMMQLMEVTPTAANIDYYITACKEQSKNTQIREIASLMSIESDSEKLRGLADKLSALSCQREDVQVVTMDEALMSFSKRHSEKLPPSFLSWPISKLDSHIYAERGDLILIGGYPSAGKSAFSLQCAWHWAQKLRVGFFSLETSSEKLFDRQMAMVARVPLAKIKQNSMTQIHWNQLAEKSKKVSKRKLELIPASGMTVADIQAIAFSRHYDVVIIDYLQLITARGRDGYERVTNISMDLHRFSQRSGCIVVALSQLSRPDKSKALNPTMSSLRESGQLEQDADLILLLYEDEDKSRDGRRILSCAKNKEGQRFKTKLSFYGETQTFEKASDKEEDFGLLSKKTKVPFEERED